MPTYLHECQKCKFIWEDIYKMSDPVPDICPKCEDKGGIKRLINWDGAGNVRLNPKDSARKAWKEGKELARKAQTDENIRANLVGEDKYHQSELSKSAAAKEAQHVINHSRPKIKYKNE